MSDSKSQDEKLKENTPLFWAVLVCAVALAIVASLTGYMHIVGNYAQKSHNSNEYVDSGEYGSIFAQIGSICNSIESITEKQKADCKTSRERIESLAGVADLRAQQTMAYATRGILVASWYQFMASVGALALVGVTLFATYRMLMQAASTANYARKTLDAANDTTDAAKKTAEAAERAEQPFLFTSFDALNVGDASEINKGETIKAPTVRVCLHNLGKTPAVKIQYMTQRGSIGGSVGAESEFAWQGTTGTKYIHTLDVGEKLCIFELSIGSFRELSAIESKRGWINILFVVAIRYQDLIRKKPFRDTLIHASTANNIAGGNRKFSLEHRMQHEERLMKTWRADERERFFAEDYGHEDDNTSNT